MDVKYQEALGKKEKGGGGTGIFKRWLLCAQGVSVFKVSPKTCQRVFAPMSEGEELQSPSSK
jgi:hypothetical protein